MKKNFASLFAVAAGLALTTAACEGPEEDAATEADAMSVEEDAMGDDAMAGEEMGEMEGMEDGAMAEGEMEEDAEGEMEEM